MPRLLGEQPQQGVLGNEAFDGDRSLAPLLWDEQGHPQTRPWQSNVLKFCELGKQ